MNVSGMRVLVVGAARSGVAAARFLLARGARVSLSEKQPLEKLTEEAKFLGVPLEAGGHTEAAFLAQDLIVVSPGVPSDLPALVAARARGIPVIGEVELACRFLQGRLVGITGSNGKTTTTALTGKLFEAAGVHSQVGGNIGTPLISLVETSRADTVNVVELSSFQLETIEQLRPTVAVVLNVTPDHLDRHPDFHSYAAAKERVFQNQTAEDFAVLNADDAVCRQYGQRARARALWFSRKHTVPAGAWVEDGDVVYSAGDYPLTVLGVEEIQLKGDHNVENVLAATCAALALGAGPQAVRRGVREFQGVEHRLEYVATVQEVDFYNDSKATNVDAAIKALEAFDGPLLVILGGLDKGSDYRPLAPLLKQKARCVLLIGSAAGKIYEQLGGREAPAPLVEAETLETAVQEAIRRAHRGDTVLLAPACASFDQFQNYEHRGRVFKELVRGMESLSH